MFSNKLLQRLLKAYSVSVLTGAGISAESGVPTFRGRDGLWRNHDVQQLATPQALMQNPQLFWEFYRWRRELLKEVQPNLGHYALVDLENRFEDFALITQNVDNLHSLAGNRNVMELHGNIMRTYCNDCGADFQEGEYDAQSAVPKCPRCGGVLRPGVVLFGEALPAKTLSQAQEAAASCEVFFSVGTSSLVEPAASLPYIAKANGAYLVEVNLERTPLSDHADEVVLGKAGKLLPALILILERLQ